MKAGPLNIEVKYNKITIITTDRGAAMEYRYDIALSYAKENEDIVNTVYHYLKAENITAFFAPSSEAQTLLSGQNQRKIFYRIFGMESKYVALSVTKHYVAKKVPMEEAAIAFSKHHGDGRVIPIYLDGTPLPETLFDPNSTNYYCSSNEAEIASLIANRIKLDKQPEQMPKAAVPPAHAGNTMNIHDNVAGVILSINELNLGKEDD